MGAPLWDRVIAQAWDKGWYVVFWVGMLVAARLWLVPPIVQAIESLKR